MNEPVGRVLGTADATPLQFWVAVTPGSYLQLDDVVITHRDVPGRQPVAISGVVTQVRARHEGAEFESDVFAIAEGTLPAQVQEAAEITTTRVEPEVYVPPAPGALVHRAAGDERNAALYFDRMEKRIPIGTGRDGEPLYLNAEFLDGSRGAHVSISGISGVATKTSFATFLLYSTFRSGVLGGEAANTKALIFNVKGEDLLFLDHPNTRLDEPTAAAYAKLGLAAGAFPDVAVYAPPRAGDTSGTPDVSSRLAGVDTFYWTLAEFCADRLLPYVFADADDEKQQYTMVVHAVDRIPGESGAAGRRRRDDRRHAPGQLRRSGRLRRRRSSPTTQPRMLWAGTAVGLGTINAFARRLIGSKKDLARLIRGDLGSAAGKQGRGDLPSRRAHAINTAEAAQVTVVDLHNLADRAQRFVVGVTLRTEFERKEKAGTAKPLLFVVLDELNKYAPRDGTSPIKEVLLDIAERGRSLGVVLIGAQQTASEVERRIVANSAVRVVGRLDPAEASRPEYGFLPPAQRARALIAKPGTMFVGQPEIPVPLVVEFPFPAWATRPAEAGAAPNATLRSITQAVDPFDVMAGDRTGELAGARGGRLGNGASLSDDDIPF